MAKNHKDCANYENNMCNIKRRAIINEESRCTCGKFRERGTIQAARPVATVARKQPDKPKRVRKETSVQTEVKGSVLQKVERRKRRAKGKGSKKSKGKVLGTKRKASTKKKKSAPKKKSAKK